jgi:hypothetical protein
MPRKTRALAAQQAPHSWSLETWPSHVYPHTAGRGRYFVRANRTALLDAGALIRVGRDLVVLGEPYTRWLAAQAARVADFKIAPNRQSAGPAP